MASIKSAETRLAKRRFLVLCFVFSGLFQCTASKHIHQKTCLLSTPFLVMSFFSCIGLSLSGFCFSNYIRLCFTRFDIFLLSNLCIGCIFVRDLSSLPVPPGRLRIFSKTPWSPGQSQNSPGK